MATNTQTLIEKINALEQELQAEWARQQAGLRFGLEQGRVKFEAEIIRRHRELKTGLWRYIRSANLMVMLTAPVIYSLILPLAMLDVFVSLYQLICFPAYGIAKVKRSDYLIFDRSQLSYLNAVEKLNCAFCSYANGLLAYAREIASRTELYWCPIKHARLMQQSLPRNRDYADFGDADAYKQVLKRQHANEPQDR